MTGIESLIRIDTLSFTIQRIKWFFGDGKSKFSDENWFLFVFTTDSLCLAYLKSSI